MMKRISLISVITILLFACKPSADKLIVQGKIEGAAGEKVYLEHLALNQTTICDSALLNEEGNFRLKTKMPEYQDIYALRLNGKRLILAVDSVRCLTVSGASGSIENSAVEASQATADIQALRRSIKINDIESHKDYARKLIIKNPLSLAAYYALFQQQNGQFVFNPYDKQDQTYFSAVATSWNVFLPQYERTKALYKLTLDAINQRRKAENTEVMRQFIADAENAFLEIELPDENGNMQKLSQYKGNVILLDFSAIEMEQSAAYIFELKELYNKYSKRGLRVYSVSGDRNRLLWENSAENLPWITVRGENGVFDSAFQTYNVQSLPTLYLLNKQGNVIGRYSDFKALGNAIDKCLR